MSEDIQAAIRAELVRQWRAHSSAPFPHIRIEETGDSDLPYRAELYYNRDEKTLEFTYDAEGRLFSIGESTPIDKDSFYTLIPVYADISKIKGGLLLTYTYSGLMAYAHGRVGNQHVDYYHCPQCNGFIFGMPERVPDTRSGLQGTAFFCRRCSAELTFNLSITEQIKALRK